MAIEKKVRVQNIWSLKSTWSEELTDIIIEVNWKVIILLSYKYFNVNLYSIQNQENLFA